MGFFRRIEEELTNGVSASPQGMPDRTCIRCNQPMQYRGPHALRTGGMNKGWGVAADLFLGAQDETALNQLMEKNVLTHIFVCPQCGAVEVVNDPQRGF